MHTGRSLTVCCRVFLLGGVLLGPGRFSLVRGGFSLVRGVLLGQGEVCLVGGFSLVPGGSPWSRGVLPGPGGVLLGPGGFSLVGGSVWSDGGSPWSWGGFSGDPSPLWTEWMTDTCKNITLATTSLRPVIKIKAAGDGEEILRLQIDSWAVIDWWRIDFSGPGVQFPL